jgi:hypothetical protein
VTLLELAEPAYGVTLASEQDALYLLTRVSAYRIVPGKPPHRMPLDLGVGAALTQSSIVFWSKGSLWMVPKQGGEPRVLAEIEHQPALLVASGERFAWLDRRDAESFTIQTLERDKAHTIYSSSGSIESIVLVEGTVFFVERKGDTWRIGSVPLDGGTPTFNQPRSGRPPSMLAAREDLFYYDGPRRSVLRLSQDFAHEQALADHFICSPIAVSDRVLCAQLGGLFEVPMNGRGPRLLTNDLHGPVSAITANASNVFWVNDVGKSGEDKLALRTLPLEASK